VTADHGHGFDVFGGVDTKYLAAQQGSRAKRRAVGVYREAGQSQYTQPAPGDNGASGVSYGAGANFPVNWDPRYTLAQGFGAMPDHREDFRVHKAGPRLPASGTDNFANPADSAAGFIVNGTLPTDEAQGVHSLTDVPVFAMGPCADTFGGVYGNIDIFYKMASCLGLARPDAKAQDIN
jgi:alkaline phosphatase